MSTITFIRNFQKDDHRCVMTAKAENGKLLSFESVWNHMPIAEEMKDWPEYRQWFVECLTELDQIYGAGSVHAATSSVDALAPNRRMAELFTGIFGNADSLKSQKNL